MDPTKERAIAERARTQLGLITIQQLRAIGVSHPTIRRRVETGAWVAVGSRTLRVAGAPRSLAVDVLALCLDLGGVASHRTALWLHGLAPPPSIIEITVAKGQSTTRTPPRDGVRIHTTTSLPADDVLCIEAIPTTSVARTLLGLAALDEAEVPDSMLLDLVEDAVRLGLATDSWLWWLLERRRCRGRNGVRRFEAALVKRNGLGPTESWLERELMGIIDRAGLPRPVVQRRIRRRGAFVARVDMLFDPGMVILEALGYAHHATRAQQNRDTARASELQNLGYDVHQLTYDQIVSRPLWVAGVISTALHRAGVLILPS